MPGHGESWLCWSLPVSSNRARAAGSKPVMPLIATMPKSAPGPVFAAFVLSLVYACALFQRLAFQSVGPLLGSELGLGAAAQADLGASFFWAYLLLMIPCGILVDRQGPRRMVIVGAMLSSAGCALFASGLSLPELMLARVIISAGGVFAFVCMMRYVGTTFSTRKTTISGRCILIGNLGAISAGAPLALMLAHLHWREVWFFLSFGWLLLAIALWAWVPRDPADKLDSVRPAALKAELRSIFGASSTYFGIVLVAGLAGTFWAFANFIGPRVLSLSQLSSTQVGMAVSVMVCGYATGAAVWGWLGDHIQRERLVVLACTVTISAWLTFMGIGSMSLLAIASILFVAGFGSGAFGLVYVILTERHEARQSGMVIACVNCGIPLGAALFQVTAGRLEQGDAMVPILAGCLLALFAAAALVADGRTTMVRLTEASG